MNHKRISVMLGGCLLAVLLSGCMSPAASLFGIVSPAFQERLQIFGNNFQRGFAVIEQEQKRQLEDWEQQLEDSLENEWDDFWDEADRFDRDDWFDTLPERLPALESNEYQDMLNGISFEDYVLPTDAILILACNNGRQQIPFLNCQVVFFDEAGNMLTASAGYAEAVLPGQQVAIWIAPPYDVQINPVEYADFEVQFIPDTEDTGCRNFLSDLVVEPQLGGRGVSARVTNQGKQRITAVEGYAVYYWQGKVSGVGYGTLTDLPSGQTKTLEFFAPAVAEQSAMQILFDDYEIILNGGYTW